MSARISTPRLVRAVTKPSDKAIHEKLTALATARGPSKTFCPSEVARALSDDWRPLMDQVRRVAAANPDLIATQGGKPADPVTATGPIRLSLRPPDDG